MSDTAGEQALTDTGVSGVQGLLSIDVDAGATYGSRMEPYPRQFVTLGLVLFCLSFWTVVIVSVAHSG